MCPLSSLKRMNMLAYLFDYIPVDILIGLGSGLFGGIIALLFAPIRFNRRPENVMDMAAYILFIFALLLPAFFPVTMFLVMIITLLAVWILIPFLLGIGKPKKVRPSPPDDIVEVVTLVSPEGRAAVLDEMGILPL